ncbi:MAG: hypothetical protein ACRECL_15115 [Bradyrhizobium sp.]
MMDDKDKGAEQKLPRSPDSRPDRLKLKLRENLKRRKVQERARTRMSAAPSARREHDPDPARDSPKSSCSNGN